jgi:DNA-binding NarL/FixJ family response regulator
VKTKILIVDDNPILRETVRSVLESKHQALRIDEAGNAKEAYARIRDQLPDLILMDIGLPDANGLQLTRRIKDLYPQIFVVIFTNYDQPEYRKAACENGADFFLSKSSPDATKLDTITKSLLATNPTSKNP